MRVLASDDVDSRPEFLTNYPCDGDVSLPSPRSFPHLSGGWVDQISGHQTALEMVPPFQNITHNPNIQNQSCSE